MRDYSDAFYLAGLLHDIGKFWQRADPNGEPQSRILTAQTKNLKGAICPPNARYGHSHKHVLWTAQFFQTFDHLFKGDVYIETPTDCSLERLSSAHHNPGNAWEGIVQQADHYASSADRSKMTDEEYSEAAMTGAKGWDKFKFVSLDSILESVDLRIAEDGEPGVIPARQLQMPAEPLSPKVSSMFPLQRRAGDAIISQEAYDNLWAGFTEGLNDYRPKSVSALCEMLSARLWTYASCFPSSTMDLPDVSLYDHLKITGAFAVCVYRYLMEKTTDFGARSTPQISSQDAPVLLVGADLSGIQSFIYDITSRRASKNLKARSFYLQQTATAACRYVLQELRLHTGHILYASGGGFYLLAPNTLDVQEKLEKARRHIEDKLFAAHRTDIYLALDSRPLTDGELMEPQRDVRSKALSQAWSELSGKLGEQKRRRYASRLVKHFNDFFTPQESGGGAALDAITGDEIPSDKVEVLEEENSATLSRHNKNIIELGRRLRKTEAVAMGNPMAGTTLAGLTNVFGVEEHKDFPEGAEFAYVWNDPAAAIAAARKYPALPVSLGFYGGNDYPADEEGYVKDFDTLAGKNVRELARIGVLRMDVDSLGQIFQRGLQNRNTLSRIATLSRSLDAFFQGYLNTLWAEGKTADGAAFSDHTYIIYSGGDDLFIVGRWDVALEFGEQIREKFRAYTGQNKSLGISGGLAIVPSRYPISKAAHIAAEAESAAKKHATNHPPGNLERKEKDAFCLAGMGLTMQRFKDEKTETSLAPLRWDTEWPLVRELQQEILGFLRSGAIPMSFLTHVGVLYAQRAGGEPFAWRWRLAYSWARLKERLKDDHSDLQQAMDNWQRLLTLDSGAAGYPESLKISIYDYFDIFQLAARLAELTHRTRFKEEQES